MRLTVSLTAWVFLLAPVLMLAQEPVVGLYEYPAPAAPRAIHEEMDMIDEDEWDDAWEMEDIKDMNEEEGWEDVEELNEAELDDDREDGLVLDDPFFKMRLYRREMPNGIYAWQIIEEKLLPDGTVEICTTSRDGNGLLDRTCSIHPAGEREIQNPCIGRKGFLE